MIRVLVAQVQIPAFGRISETFGYEAGHVPVGRILEPRCVERAVVGEPRIHNDDGTVVLDAETGVTKIRDSNRVQLSDPHVV